MSVTLLKKLIYWDCALSNVLHIGEVVIEDHMILGGAFPVLIFRTNETKNAWNRFVPGKSYPLPLVQTWIALSYLSEGLYKKYRSTPGVLVCWTDM